MNENKNNTKLIFLSPGLEDESGHFFTYTNIIQKVAQLNSWEYAIAIPKISSITPTPSHWHRITIIGRLPRCSFLKKAYHTLSHFFSLITFLRKHLDPEKKNIIFIDIFSRHHIRFLAYAFFFLQRKNISLWLMYRQHSPSCPDEHNERFFRRWNRYFSYLLGDENLKLLTDSALLKAPLSKFYDKNVHLFPVIDTSEIPLTPFSCHRGDRLRLWWPGIPRENKGLNTINNILPTLDKASTIEVDVVLSEDAVIDYKPERLHLIKLPSTLSSQDYLSQLCSADVILLPYDAETYRWKTSGIFIEAIAAGKPVLVTEGTWMAHEAKNFGLSEFITEWENKNITKKLQCICHDTTIHKKLSSMQKHYREYHSVESFSRAMNLLTR